MRLPPSMQDPILTESHIIDLEIRLTHQEATLQALNECIVRQQKIMDQLVRQIATLQEQLRAGTSVAPAADETLPPHY